MNNRDYLREIWTQRPPDDTIKPPEYPPRPDLFDEVEWGPYVTPEQAKLAYRLWSLPDGVLGEEVLRLPQRYPRPNVQAERDSLDMHALAHNVYEHLMHDARLPKKEEPWDATAQMKTADDGRVGGWSYEEIFASSHNSENSSEASVDETILIEGEDVLTARYWTVVRLQAELKRRGLEHRGKSAEMRRRLHDHELQRRRTAEREETKGHRGVSSILPRTDLSQWGVPRQDDYMIKITKGAHFSPLDMYTWAISLSPYNPAYWVSRSYLYYQQSFFDLAIGDAYRAQLLCEVLVNPRDRNRQPGLYTRIWHAIEQHILQTPLEDGKLPPPIKRMRESNGVNSFIPTVRKALHNIMSLSLKALQCWHDYDHMEQYLPQRVVMPDRDMDAFKSRKAYTENFVKAQKEKKGRNPKLFFFEKRAGSITARNYPYSAIDLDRTSRQFLDRLNHEILDSQLPWKRFEIKAHHNQPDELGVYATEYIEEGRIIYAEEPSVRGHLNITRHVDIHNRQATKPDRCDNCHRKIAGDLEDRYGSRTDRDSILNGEHAHACACAFTVDEPTYFCPRRQDSHEEGGQQASHGTSEGNETCLQIARKLYHFRTCGRNWAWLHDAMRQNWNRHRTGNEKRPTHITHTFEDHGTVLSLALREVFDMTLLRRQRSRNPYLLAHELDELLPLQGESNWECQQFPFTLTANIQVPFDILLRLGVDIFRDLTFDTWVIQIVLRKLLLSVVPWDEERRDENCKVDDNKAERIKNDTRKKQRDAERRGVGTRDAGRRDAQTHDTDESDYDPTFRALYLFPGFAMFNHTCTPRYNAEWAFDNEIPNRIVVWAAKGISPQDEIRIRYRQHPLSEDNVRRTIGDLCACTHCERRGEYRPPDETDESPSSECGPSEPHIDPRNEGNQERGRTTSGNQYHRGGDRDQGPARDDEEASTEIDDHETQPESNISHEESLETRSRRGSREDSSELPQEESTTDVGSQPDPSLEKMTHGQVEAISRKRKRSADMSEDMELPQKRDTRKAFAGYKRQKPRDPRAPRKSAYFQCRS